MGAVLMKLLLAGIFAVMALAAEAHSLKPCDPCAGDVLAEIVVDLQKEGWWQMVPNGGDPNDQTYMTFIESALLSLRAHVPPGKLKYVIEQLGGGR